MHRQLSRAYNGCCGGLAETRRGAECMNQNLPAQHAASLSRIAAGVDVLAARVKVDDQVLTVRADQTGQALRVLHGTPEPGLRVAADIEYFAMPVEEFAALPDWQRALQRCLEVADLHRGAGGRCRIRVSSFSRIAMCVTYTPISRPGLDFFNTVAPADAEWPAETWQDYAAPFIRRGADGGRETVIGTYGMVPQKKIPADVRKFSTMNARAETVGSLRSYAGPWRQGQLALTRWSAFTSRTGRPASMPGGRSRCGMPALSPWRASGAPGARRWRARAQF